MSQEPNNSIDLAAARARLAKDGEKRLWQSLEELSDTQEFRAFKENEFPANSELKMPSRFADEVGRRDMLKMIGVSAALTGLGACTKLPTEYIVPYVRPPEEIIPGRPLFYASSVVSQGVAAGVLVWSYEGRPTKMEGNPEHPGSLGAADVFTMASILNMYDPDRSQAVFHDGRVTDWNAFAAAMADINQQVGANGAGLRILTKTVGSPTLGSQIKKLLTMYPGAKWHQYEPVSGDSVREGARLAFGKYVNTVYHFEKADVVLSLDADFFNVGQGHVRYTKDFTARRDLAKGPDSNPNRLYVVESMPSSTGASADHRLPLRSCDVEAFARAVAGGVGVSVAASPNGASLPVDWTQAVARDLVAHRGASIVIAGEQQPPFVHALTHAMNAALGNVGSTVAYTEPVEANPTNEMDSLKDLVADLQAGHVQLLLILDANPVYDAPADLQFSDNIFKAQLTIHSGLYNDETAELCHWHIPATHGLETWSDARAYDGTAGIVQPLIAPLYSPAHSAHEILALFTGDAGTSGHNLVRDYWQGQRTEKGQAFEALWETSLRDGVIAGTAAPATAQTVSNAFLSQTPSAPAADQLEIVFLPDPSIGDGYFANNGWLQELPKPITRLTWDNAAMVSPATAQKLGLNKEDYVTLTLDGRTVDAGVYIVPGHADNSVTLHLGYGRRRAGKVGTGPGFNAYLIQTSSTPSIATGLQIKKTGQTYSFASTQQQYTIDVEGQPYEQESVTAIEPSHGRDLIQIATLDEFKKNPDFAKNAEEDATEHLSIYPGWSYNGYAWGMSIDLNRCVGCNACVVACQAENNIAVVGKEQVERGRAMHWIRIDTYFRGNLDAPEMYYEPMPCMQCENAPCEYVCPVGATTHSSEGLNDMIYNRCVGTRYCSNNCPYKVRRFNFYLFSDYTTPSLYGVRNPNVTVRSRGVMEKCTYCVQRINAAKIKSEEENRWVRDGEILTACQQTCPADAIVFGNINDPTSRVAKLKAQSRNYRILTDLNTRPRTSFLARVRNANPEIRS
ncbi:MAG TPA: TAT-variant-translocated molybdopterin oxidoreductase [Candidatus Aquilonibacter sp.]|nr:TAT-variant-translocated molybdopterin oxidoreductase [Candidatus Aquilonibacter sp.]